MHRPEALDQIRTLLAANDDRTTKAKRLAQLIRSVGPYRWVGLYDVNREEIAVIAWSGPAPPTHPRFPATQGLCGAAVSSGATVIVGDVSQDPRYLTTFGSTQSEIVVPVRGSATAVVVGLIDVESERLNAFTYDDRRFLEHCAATIAAFWQ